MNNDELETTAAPTRGDDAASAVKGTPTEAADAAETPVSEVAPRPPAAPRLFRSIYWGVWFVLAPFVLACVLVWALTPPSGVAHGGLLGWFEDKVRDQPVPFGIVTFTFFEMLLWGLRHRLPLAMHAYPPIRAGLPDALRVPFERARLLLDEARYILQQRASSVERELTSGERRSLQQSLESLEAAMAAEPFEQSAFQAALTDAEAQSREKLARWRKSELREVLESVLIAFAVAMVLRTFVIEAFKIPSGSMIPTLQVGDHIFVNKFTYGPAIPWTQKRAWSAMPPSRGDVIVFAYPEHPEQDFIKRAIAIPGDTLEVRGGHPILNGWQVPSCLAGNYTYEEQQEGFRSRHEGEVFVEFLEDEAYLTLYDRQGLQSEYQGPFVVKEGEVWVMGDNRNNSHDSRMWFGGTGGGVPFSNIRGRALFVWLSFADTIDWSRMFAPVMGRPPNHGPLPGMNPALVALEGPIEKCLRERPPLDQTRPPSRGGVIR